MSPIVYKHGCRQEICFPLTVRMTGFFFSQCLIKGHDPPEGSPPGSARSKEHALTDDANKAAQTARPDSTITSWCQTPDGKHLKLRVFIIILTFRRFLAFSTLMTKANNRNDLK